MDKLPFHSEEAMPPFEIEKVQLWLIKAELYFNINNIKNEMEKFQFVVHFLPAEIASLVVDLVKNPTAIFEELKTRLLFLSSKSASEKVTELLDGPFNGKPSVILAKMRSLANNLNVEDFLRTIFLKHLPPAAQIMLALCDAPLDDLAIMADTVVSHSNAVNASAVAIAKTSTPHEKPGTSFTLQTPVSFRMNHKGVARTLQYNTDTDMISNHPSILQTFKRIKLPPQMDLIALSQISNKDNRNIQTLMLNKKRKIIPVKILNSSDPVFCDIATNEPKIYVPSKHRQRIVTHFHSTEHADKSKPPVNSASKICSLYIWPSIKKDVKIWIKSCIICKNSSSSSVSSPRPFKLSISNCNALYRHFIGETFHSTSVVLQPSQIKSSPSSHELKYKENSPSNVVARQILKEETSSNQISSETSHQTALEAVEKSTDEITLETTAETSTPIPDESVTKETPSTQILNESIRNSPTQEIISELTTGTQTQTQPQIQPIEP